MPPNPPLQLPHATSTNIQDLSGRRPQVERDRNRPPRRIGVAVTPELPPQHFRRQRAPEVLGARPRDAGNVRGRRHAS